MSKNSLIPDILNQNPVMGLLADLFGGITDSYTPSINQNSSLLGLKWEKCKMQDRATISDCETRIAQNNVSKFSAQADLVGKILALPLTIQMATQQTKHQEELFKLEQNKLTLENQMLETEALRGASELKLMLQEIKKAMKDGSSED